MFPRTPEQKLAGPSERPSSSCVVRSCVPLAAEYMPGGTLASWLHPKSSSAQQAAAAAAHRSALSQHPPPGFAREREGSGPHGAGSKSWESDSGRKRAAAAHLRPYLERLTMALEVRTHRHTIYTCRTHPCRSLVTGSRLKQSSCQVVEATGRS